MEIQELNASEIDQVSGGGVPLAIAVTIVIAAAAGGYTVGKDRANRDNRND